MVDEQITIYLLQFIKIIIESLFEDKTYHKANFINTSFQKSEYENCVFNNCDFSNADFSHSKFIDCQFANCNLSLIKLVETIFRDVKFMGCKMIGLLFYNGNKFGLSFTFDNCTLNHSSFASTKIRKTVFKNCYLHEVDFTDCDLAGSLIFACDLSNAKFEHTILESADLRTSFNYIISPDSNKIKKAKFSLTSIEGLLHTFNIEIDKTT